MNPFTNDPGERISQWGENHLLGQILEWLGGVVPPAPEGPGEDCARIPGGIGRAITTDPVWYRRHFDDDLSPEAVGRKLVVRNLSDLAAAGARPEAGLLSLFAPDQTSRRWLQRCVESIGQTAAEYQLKIVGGDLSQTPSDLGLNLTVWGALDHPSPGRGKAEPGDTLWVSGQLGGSLLGPHWQFLPRLAEGDWLAASGSVTAMMDLSDGLAADLPRLLGQRGASLDLHLLPLRPEADIAAQRSGQPPWLHGWSDGEDYELLWALHHSIPPEQFLAAWTSRFKVPATCIGHVVERADRDALLQFVGDRIPPEGGGFQHFRP